MTDAELIYRALNLWANHVETGNIALSATDAQRMGEESSRESGASIRNLTADQAKLVKRMRALAIEELKRRPS